MKNVTCNGDEFCFGDMDQISVVMIFDVLKAAWVASPPFFLHPTFYSTAHQDWWVLADVRKKAMDVMLYRWCPKQYHFTFMQMRESL